MIVMIEIDIDVLFTCRSKIAGPWVCDGGRSPIIADALAKLTCRAN